MKPDTFPIEIYVPGTPQDDPRQAKKYPPWVRVRTGPPLHPDDLAVVDGIPVTSIARTLVDLAEVCDRSELAEIFSNVREQGRLDVEMVDASMRRVEWRPSLPMLQEVLNEFRDE